MKSKLVIILLTLILNPASVLASETIIPVIYAAIQAPSCTQEKINSILSQPVYENGVFRNYQEVINCSTTLPKGSIVKKVLIFNQSNVVFDCNFSSIRPTTKGPVYKGPINTNNPDSPRIGYQRLLMDMFYSISISSKRSQSNNNYRWDQTKNVIIKNCSEVLGSVRINSSYYTPSSGITAKEYKINRGPDYVQEIRNTSPTRIIFDNITIINKRKNDAVYFDQGVTHSILKNSNIYHDNTGVSLYLSAESGFNVIENNVFHHNSTIHLKGLPRELLALDSTEGNVIRKNWFSGLDDGDGGILLYRNCGEKGLVRYTAPRHNIIEENIFYYSNSIFGSSIKSHPPVFIGSRNGSSPGLDNYCSYDGYRLWTYEHVNPDWNWDADWESSSTINLDLARYNIVRNNRTCNKSPYFKISNPGSNHSNVISNNTRIYCGSSTPMPR